MDIFNLASEFRAAQYGVGGGGSASGGPAGDALPQSLGSSIDPPPSGNTGGKLTTEGKRGLTSKIDWLNFSGRSVCVPVIKTIVEARLGPAELVDRGLNTYQRFWRWPTGAALCFTEGRQDCLLSMNGDSIDACSDADDQLRLLRQMHGYGFRTTRVDLAADDWERRVPLEQVHAAAEACDFTNFRLTDCRQPKRVDGGELKLAGDMRTFGRRGRDGSGVFLRIYDKALESKGEIDCIRWEVEFGNERAHEVGRRLADCEDVDQLRAVVSALIGGAIDFRRRAGETHVDRRERLGWWQSFLQLLGEAHVVVNRVKAPLQATAVALRRQWSRSLAYLRIAAERVGVDFFSHLREMIDRACEVVDPRQLDGRELELNLTEAFRLGSRPGGNWAPASVLDDCPI